MKFGFVIKRFIRQRPFKRVNSYLVTTTCKIPVSLTAGYTVIAAPLDTPYQHIKNITLSPTLKYDLITIGSNQCYVIANDLLKESRCISLQYSATVKSRFPHVEVNPIVEKVYDYTLSHLTYGNAIRGLYSYEQSMKKRCVDSGGFSSVMQKLLADEGIRSRIVAGFWAGYEKSTMHAWLEYEHSENVWVPLDASTDFLSRQGRTYKTGGCGFVGSDRIVLSTSSHHDFTYKSIHTSIDILQTPISIQSDNSIKYIEDYSFSTSRT